MKTWKSLATLLMVVLLASCASTTSSSSSKRKDFSQVSFPNAKFKVGQIIFNMYNPRSTVIHYQVNLREEQIPAPQPGWQIDDALLKQFKSNIALTIGHNFKTRYGMTQVNSVDVELTNMETINIRDSLVKRQLIKDIGKDDNLRLDLESGVREQYDFRSSEASVSTGQNTSPSRYEIVTAALSAQISFTLFDANNQPIAIDAAALNKFNRDLKVDFALATGSTSPASNSGLVVATANNYRIIKGIMSADL